MQEEGFFITFNKENLHKLGISLDDFTEAERKCLYAMLNKAVRFRLEEDNWLNEVAKNAIDYVKNAQKLSKEGITFVTRAEEVKGKRKVIIEAHFNHELKGEISEMPIIQMILDINFDLLSDMTPRGEETLRSRIKEKDRELRDYIWKEFYPHL